MAQIKQLPGYGPTDSRRYSGRNPNPNQNLNPNPNPNSRHYSGLVQVVKATNPMSPNQNLIHNAQANPPYNGLGQRYELFSSLVWPKPCCGNTLLVCGSTRNTPSQLAYNHMAARSNPNPNSNPHPHPHLKMNPNHMATRWTRRFIDRRKLH